MADVVNDCYDDKLGHVTIIDCRYAYEFDGGHIKVSSIFRCSYTCIWYKFFLNSPTKVLSKMS